MAAPTSMIPKSNMPAYAFLAKNPLDPAYIRKCMDVLGFPYAPADIAALGGKTEMDAMVAYLQKLGTGIPKAAAASVVGDLKNPFPKDPAALQAGAQLFAQNCAACHGNHGEGGIGPELEPESYTDAALFELIYSGITDNGMPSFAALGSNRVWQLVNFVNYRKEH
jgi:cytochrome c oxidase cbb3-type subunit 2